MGRKRQRGEGEPCKSCGSTDTFVNTTRKILESSRTYPAFVVRRRYWTCGACELPFRTEEKETHVCEACRRRITEPVEA